MTTLAAYRTKVLALLNDPSLERFTNDQVDAALTFAVEDYSRYRPLARTYAIDSTGEQRIVLPADFNAFSVVRAEWVNSGYLTDEIAFYTYMQDEQWILETNQVTVPVGEVLNLTYYCMHTIDTLGSATGTTIPDQDEDLVVLGAAGEAARSRAVSKVESNNLNPNEANFLMKLSQDMLKQFQIILGRPETGFQSASWADSSIDKGY
jgi:hypothetical protein